MLTMAIVAVRTIGIGLPPMILHQIRPRNLLRFCDLLKYLAICAMRSVQGQLDLMSQQMADVMAMIRKNQSPRVLSKPAGYVHVFIERVPTMKIKS